MGEPTPEVDTSTATATTQPSEPSSETQPGLTAQQPTPPTAEPEVNWEARVEAQRKVNRDLEKKLNSIQGALTKAFGIEGEKPETDKLAEQVGSLQAKIDAAERKSRLLELASEHAIPKNYLHLLTATDDETLTAQATAVAELVKGRTPGTPQPDPTQGAQPTSTDAAAEAEYRAYYPG